MNITVEYFARFGELAGCQQEQVSTDAATVAELYQQLQRRHQLPPRSPSIRAAVNNAFTDWSQPLAENDVVALMPPVSGG